MADDNPTSDELRARGFTEDEIATVARIQAEGIPFPKREALHLVPPETVASGIVEFLRARYDEREARAHAVEREPGEAWWTSAGLSDPDIWNLPAGDAAFIADNDPAFVLADIAAKRQIVEAHQSLWQDEPPEHLGPGCKTCSGEVEGWPCTTLRLLALPFAGHPDCDESWRP